MKRHVLSHAASVLALAFALNASGQQEEARPAADARPEAAAEAPAPVVDPLFAVPTVELNGFGSDEPVIRADEPTRGVIHIPIADVKRMAAQHWEQFDCVSFKARRWGRYEVRLTYTLRHAGLGTQFRIAGQSLKKPLLASSTPKQVVYGQVNIAEPGVCPFTLYIAATGAESGFDIQDISLVPAPEGPVPAQAADGSLVLEAKSATTWSENMRYEPKPEKNCLGFWTSADDFAEWGFDVVKPGRYKVSVVHGCGGGNEGSEVAVKCGGQELKFNVKDTGGFQKWSEVAVGEIEIKDKGTQYLTIDPVTKKKSAVLDVSKVVLTPAG